MRYKLKGVGQIVEWSIRDESLHSNAGCWLFRTLLEEKPELKIYKEFINSSAIFFDF